MNMCDTERVDVVIPARNTAGTIPTIIRALKDNPGIGKVIVCVDWQTQDDTKAAAYFADIIVNKPYMQGKGQTVMAGLEHVSTPWVMFCDADITGLTQEHISLLIADAMVLGPYESLMDRMTIGVPDVPNNYPESRLWAWSWVSGQRCLPMRVVKPLNLHGYLMETQINRAAKASRLALNFEWLAGLHSEYAMSEQRLQDMERDAQWGRVHGLL